LASSRSTARQGGGACRPNGAQREGRTVRAEGRPPCRLLSAIDDGRYSFEELKDRIADDKPPSTRSLRRYLAVLSEAGFPWYFDRNSSTYKFAEGYSLRRLNLSQRELLGLVTLKRLGSSLGGTLSAYIDETTAKLLQSSDQRSATAMQSSSLAIRLESVALEPHAERNFETLQTAERDHRVVQFDYIDKRGAKTQRRVDPYGFIVSNGRIYLVAYDHNRSEMRSLRSTTSTRSRCSRKRSNGRPTSISKRTAPIRSAAFGRVPTLPT